MIELGPGGIEAVLFDMDGTIVHSDYDWLAIREELGVSGPSIIDALNGLPGDARKAAWARLEAIEAEASRTATLVAGAGDLVRWLAEQGVKTALVTNNSEANARALLERFGLVFDVVITRDSGLFKPSGAPLSEAMRRLGCDPKKTVAVGDSHYDVKAARDAGCAAVIVVNGGCRQWGRLADLAFDDLATLQRFFAGVSPAS